MAGDWIFLSPRAVARVLGVTAAGLVLASIAGQLSIYLTGHDHMHGLIPLFNVDNEQNIPTYFSSSLLLCAATLLAVITVIERKAARVLASYWGVLAFGFLVMSVDEAASLHEKLSEPMDRLLGPGRPGIFYSAWVVAGIVVVAACALFFLKLLRRLPATTRSRFLVAGALYVGGAIGLELIGNLYANSNGRHGLAYGLIATVEESLEMSGAIVMIYALLEHIAHTYRAVGFRFGHAGGSAEDD
jgi:hypothetical protein